MLHLRVGVADHLYPLIGTAARRSPLPRERFSPLGTFRTSRDVRLESGMRTKAAASATGTLRKSTEGPILMLAHSPIEMSSSATVERAFLTSTWPRKFIVSATSSSTEVRSRRDASQQSGRRLAFSWQSAYSISHELGCRRRSIAQKTLGRRTERRADRAPSRV